jgi:hypothetical protein
MAYEKTTVRYPHRVAFANANKLIVTLQSLVQLKGDLF